MTIIDEELKRIKTNVLFDKPTIWEDYSLLQEHPLDERLDNHYFSAAYEKALLELQKLDPDKYEIRRLQEIMSDHFTGLQGEEEGDIPLIEKSNVMPNVILPSFAKFAAKEEVEEARKNMIIEKDNILLSKDGSPGVVSAVSEGLIEALKEELGYEQTAIATHVYKIILKEDYRKYAPFIGAFMNSKLGQALVRRYVSGSVSPTIRKDDVDKIIVVIPKEDALAKEARTRLAELQRQAIAYSRYVQYSNGLVSMIFGALPSLPKLPINWMPGGKRDPHGYDKE